MALTLGVSTRDAKRCMLRLGRQRLPSRRAHAAQPQVHWRTVAAAGAAATLQALRRRQRCAQLVGLPIGQAVKVYAGGLRLLPQLLRRQQAINRLRLAAAGPCCGSRRKARRQD